MVLGDAIYFNAEWDKRFQRSDTRVQPFHLGANKDLATPLMHGIDAVNFTENDTCQAIELPYRGGRLLMLILLPRQIGGLTQLEKQINLVSYNDIVGKMKRQKVEIFVPRFDMDYTANLIDALNKMGITDAFNGERADFSGISGQRNGLYISELYHKSRIELSERVLKMDNSC